MLCLVAQLCPTPCDPMDCSPPGSSVPWGNSPGKNTGVGWCLWHCRQILYQLSHQGSPWILQWVAYLFSWRSSPPRNQTGVTCITGRFFTRRGTREALVLTYPGPNQEDSIIPEEQEIDLTCIWMHLSKTMVFKS